MWQLPLQNPIGDVLKPIVEVGAKRVETAVHHLVHQPFKLLLSQGQVEAILERLHRGCARLEARQLRPYCQNFNFNVCDPNEDIDL